MLASGSTQPVDVFVASIKRGSFASTTNSYNVVYEIHCIQEITKLQRGLRDSLYTRDSKMQNAFTSQYFHTGSHCVNNGVVWNTCYSGWLTDEHGVDEGELTRPRVVSGMRSIFRGGRCSNLMHDTSLSPSVRPFTCSIKLHQSTNISSSASVP